MRLIDADALNLLAKYKGRVGENTVLTPHPGEMARLTGASVYGLRLDLGGAKIETCPLTPVQELIAAPAVGDFAAGGEKLQGRLGGLFHTCLQLRPRRT